VHKRLIFNISRLNYFSAILHPNGFLFNYSQEAIMDFFSSKQDGSRITQGIPEKIERITWNPKYSVHVELLDAQHRELFTIMNRIADLYESRSTDLLLVFQDLVKYVIEHFRAENMIMIKAEYPGFSKQSKEHEQFTDTIMGFLTDYKKQDEQLIYRMLIYIRDWLLSHTQQVDMLYADYLLKTGTLERVTS
jgi:hemerythrin